MGYDSSDTIVAQHTGRGTNFIKHLNDEEAQYCYFSIDMGDEKTIECKFVFLCWVGEKCNIRKKARIPIEKADVKKIVRAYQIHFHFTEKTEFNLANIYRQLAL